MPLNSMINEETNIVKSGNVFKGHNGFITTDNVSICSKNGYYRASICDGEQMSNKVLFHSNLNNQVENELVGEGKVSTVKLEIVRKSSRQSYSWE